MSPCGDQVEKDPLFIEIKEEEEEDMGEEEGEIFKKMKSSFLQKKDQKVRNQ